MKTLAAILVESGKPLELVDIEIPALKPGQVLVEIAYSGICHTQLLEVRGHRGVDKYLPHCLGHEGSGTVLETGAGVMCVKAGDRVILSWIKGKGYDVPGCVYTWNDRKVNSGAITTFSKLAVISENRLTLIPGNAPMQECALLGCAVPTGMGVVFNTIHPKSGQSLAVFGVGGVGLCAIAAASIAGCYPVIAIDINPKKLEVARQMGATHCIDASKADPLKECLSMSPGGLDYAVEVSGNPKVMAQAVHSVRNLGGTAVIVGNAAHGQVFELDPLQFNLGKRVLGTWGGESRPEEDFPRYLKLLMAGKINTDFLTANVYSLEDANAALDDLEAGRAVRPLLDMSRA